MPASFSQFASSVDVESAFSVLAIAKRLIAAGKDVIELEIGDSPFPTPPKAIEAGVQAIRDGHSRYGPSLGIMEFRKAAAEYVNREYGIVGRPPRTWSPGRARRTSNSCSARRFSNPGDGVLVFSPHFPTYPPNIFRRNARVVISQLKAVARLPAEPRRRRRFLAERQIAARDLSQQPAQSHRRCRHIRRSRRGSPTWCAAKTSRSSATNRTTAWCGAAGITRYSNCPACSNRRSRPTRSASRSA